MKTISKDEYLKLEDALNHLFEAGKYAEGANEKVVSEMTMAFNLVFEVVDPMREDFES